MQSREIGEYKINAASNWWE